ncbi:MAG: GNAT family acetyltransferase [Tissierellia bacterium]|nr:GNAT family acetyltransferase [Tissierellia bacterium]
MIYSVAEISDIEELLELQKRYHVNTISEEDRPQGFVTTLFTKEQLSELIEKEQGVIIARSDGMLIAYAMNGSWEYWKQWPLFQYMIEDLPGTFFNGISLNTENTYQYGPVCIHTDYRGRGVLKNIVEYSRLKFGYKYPIMLTFINSINSHSKVTHVDGVGLEIIKTFPFNNNIYLELGYDNSKPIKGNTL